MIFRRTLLAAGVAMTSLQAVASDALPRVFFTPQERTEVVQRRSVALRTPSGATAPAADANPSSIVQAATPVLRLEGLSIASSGATFAWISGQRYANGARLAGHRLDISAQGVVMVDASGRSRRIRVGEVLK